MPSNVSALTCAPIQSVRHSLQCASAYVEVDAPSTATNTYDRSLLAGRTVEHKHRVARIVDDRVFAHDTRLPHRLADALAPSDVEPAEPAVAMAVRLLRPVGPRRGSTLPEQDQGDRTTSQLGMATGVRQADHARVSGARACRINK